MLSVELICTALLERKCLRKRLTLASDEFVVSRTAFPALYGGGESPAEAAYLREIARAIPTVLSDPNLSFQAREELRTFMALVVANGQMHREEFVHRYIFEFWDTLWEDPTDAVYLGEKYFKGRASSAQTRFAKELLSLLRTPEAEIDIVALGGRQNRSLYIIEIKLGALDDRGVGQILRYYRLSREACDRYYHGCDIRAVVPILIVKDIPLLIWDAIPQYFRESLRLFVYRVQQNRVILCDARRQLQSQSRDRLYA